jgi:hypothetical protein
LKRVEVFDKRKFGGWKDEVFAGLVEQELHEKVSFLIVVNTKCSARSLFQPIAVKKLRMSCLTLVQICVRHNALTFWI